MKKLILVLAVMVFASLAYGNLLVNAGFETAAGGTGGNATTPLGWYADNEVGSEGWAAEAPSTNGIAFYAWNTGAWGYMLQEVSVDISSGSEFTFEINGLAEANYNSSLNETYLKLEFWDAGGSTMYSAHTNDVYAAMVADRGNWNTYSVNATNNNASIGMVKVIFGGGNWVDNVAANQSAFWDNASLVQIPEPVTAVLLCMGIGTIYCFRRRKQ